MWELDWFFLVLHECKGFGTIPASSRIALNGGLWELVRDHQTLVSTSSAVYVK